VVKQVEGLVGDDAAGAVTQMLESAAKPQSSIPAIITGFLMLLVGAIGVFVQLQDALNTIWEADSRPSRGIVGMIRDRLLSFSMVFGIAFLLLVSLIISAGISAMTDLFGSRVRHVRTSCKFCCFVRRNHAAVCDDVQNPA
jgi:membrane protein